MVIAKSEHLIAVYNTQSCEIPISKLVNFAAGGIASPADAALMMQLGSDGIFVGSGIFKAKNPKMMAKAIVEATLHFDDPSIVAEVSKGLGESMPGVEISKLAQEQRMQERGY